VNCSHRKTKSIFHWRGSKDVDTSLPWCRNEWCPDWVSYISNYQKHHFSRWICLCCRLRERFWGPWQVPKGMGQCWTRYWLSNTTRKEFKVDGRNECRWRWWSIISVTNKRKLTFALVIEYLSAVGFVLKVFVDDLKTFQKLVRCSGNIGVQYDAKVLLIHFRDFNRIASHSQCLWDVSAQCPNTWASR